jgi:large subunit ribosomal protein L19
MSEDKQAKKEPQKEAPKTEEKKEEKMPVLKSGMTVRVSEKIKDIDPKGEERTRVQVFEGIILAVKKPKTPSGTILVRKVSHNNVGVEKIFPIHSPLVDKVEVLKEIKTRRSKLYFLPDYKKRLKVKKKRVAKKVVKKEKK